MLLLAQVDALLRHPLTTLVFGALLSGILIPMLTRDWQLRQKRLEVKVGLVAELSELVMRFLMAVQFVRVGARSFTQEAFDEAYREWEVGSAVFGTRLQAYVGDGGLAAEWTRFSEAMTVFYAIEGTPAEQRAGVEAHLRTLLGEHLAEAEGDPWGRHRQALLQWKSSLIRRLMQARIQLVA